MEYETENRHYGHIDCPGHADYIKVYYFLKLLLALLKDKSGVVKIIDYSRDCTAVNDV